MNQTSESNILFELLRECYRIGQTPIWRSKRARLQRSKRARKRQGLSPITRPSSFALEGLVQPGDEGIFEVDGERFELDDNVWMVGEIRPGAIARVSGTVTLDGIRVANKVTILSAH